MNNNVFISIIDIIIISSLKFLYKLQRKYSTWRDFLTFENWDYWFAGLIGLDLVTSITDDYRPYPALPKR